MRRSLFFFTLVSTSAQRLVAAAPPVTAPLFCIFYIFTRFCQLISLCWDFPESFFQSIINQTSI